MTSPSQAPRSLHGTHQSVAPDVVLGRDVRLSSFINLYGCRIGDDTTIGAFVEIQRGASIGARCKVSSHSFVCEGVTIADECFVGHGVTFINDRYPRSVTDSGRVQGAHDWQVVPTRVERGASIGSGATVLCGVTIGERSMVGAGALVTKDVPPGQLAVGAPARVVGPAPGLPQTGQPTVRISKVPFTDLTDQHRRLRGQILAAWSRILDSANFVSGSEVRAFEEEFAEACGVAHCVAVSSGTDALALGLRALGLRAGEEVVVPTNSFIATAEAVSHAGGVPALVDCDGQTYTIDPGGVAARAGEKVRGVIGVHLYGRPADWDALKALARPQGWWTVEDAAQAHLARYRDRPVGSLGALAAFSFYPAKNLGAPGEGGAVTTGDPALAQELRMLRDHGQARRYRSDLVGYNARMSELVAATLRIKLPYLPEWTEARRRVAAWYRQRLADHPDIGLPVEPGWARSVHHLFVVAVAQRDRVQTLMDEAGVETGLHYPVPIHLQPAYRHLGHDVGAFPQAELAAESLLSLPMFPTLGEDQVDYLCEVLRRSVQQGLNRGGPR